jgi:arylsulfatase A-like enzyme
MKPILIFLICSLSVSFGNLPPASKLPNIILIYLDDMGNGDLTVTGALEYQTPHIDRLAQEGIRFTNFHTVQAVCSASRAALLTGCYPNRIGISGAFMPWSKTGLNPSETTLAELVKQKGYKTAIVGKWHLGSHPSLLPLQQGFDSYFGLPYSNDMWPVWFDGQAAKPEQKQKFSFPPLPLIQNNETIETIKTLDDQSLLTKRYTEKAIEFIESNKKDPFFLYLPHSMPHVPIAASPAFKGKSKQGTYGDVMMEIDWSVGEIMRTLERLKLDKNTLVLFSSDNGPWLNFGDHAGSTGGLREGKGSIWEGGHRVPLIARWKDKIPGGLISNKLAATIDLFPTIAAICGLSLPNHPIDGIDIMPLLLGQDRNPRKYLYYYYDRNNLKGVRRDDWKLILPHKGRSYKGYKPGQGGFPGETNERYSAEMALYDLRRDPGEAYDVQNLYPEIVTELLQVAEMAREDLGDELTERIGKNTRPAAKVD